MLCGFFFFSFLIKAHTNPLVLSENNGLFALGSEVNHCYCAPFVHGGECCGCLVGSGGLSLLGHDWLQRIRNHLSSGPE